MDHWATAAQLTNGQQGWVGTSEGFNNESLVLAVYRLSMTESGKITEAANVPRAGTLQRQGGAPLHEAATHSDFQALGGYSHVATSLTMLWSKDRVLAITNAWFAVVEAAGRRFEFFESYKRKGSRFFPLQTAARRRDHSRAVKCY